MSAPKYKLLEGSLQHRFQMSRNKIQMFGGGFANGKTTSAVVKGLSIAKDYPGANILMARSTYPKLNDTLRKEFLKWCPSHWIESFPMSANASNTCTLVNGTTINFRYIAQQGKNAESTTSNLLSATYDLIIVDQVEDPEIVHKDFTDLLGRLRGNTPYKGDDPTMPRNGPRWMILMCNPTRNWVYKKIVKPLHVYQKTGYVSEDLLCERDPETLKPVLDENGKPNVLIDLFEGSTYENKANLGEDFIKTLEATYRGQMRDRFLLGNWAGYEGLVYWMYDDSTHGVPGEMMADYYRRLPSMGVKPTIIEAYDYGLSSPSCYLFGFVDHVGNICWLDGFHQPEFPLEEQAKEIRRIRRKWVAGGVVENAIYADPAIFKRTTGPTNIVGKSIAAMFEELGIKMRRGNNNKLNGITKVQGYLYPQQYHRNPFTGMYEAPYMYVNLDLEFVSDEFNGYYWKTNTEGAHVDEPQDKNDHALDAIKYGVTDRPLVAKILPLNFNRSPVLTRWSEEEPATMRNNAHRYG